MSAQIDIRGPIRFGGKVWPIEYSAPDFHPLNEFFISQMSELDPKTHSAIVFGHGFRDKNIDPALVERHIGFYAPAETLVAVTRNILQNLEPLLNKS